MNTALAEKINITIYGDESYPPYSFLHNNRPDGIYYDILKEILADMPEFNVDIQTLPYKRALFMLEENQIYALYPPYKRLLARPYMSYSDPIFTETVVMMCKKSVINKRPAVFPDDFGKVLIGINRGFVMGDNFVKALAEKRIRIEEARGNSENIKKLLAQRIDCYSNDRLSILNELNKFSAKERDSIEEVMVTSTEQGYLGFNRDNRQPFHDKFLKDFNANLAKAKKSGRLESIFRKWSMPLNTQKQMHELIRP